MTNDLNSQMRCRGWAGYQYYMNLLGDSAPMTERDALIDGMPLTGVDILLVGGGRGVYSFSDYVLNKYNFTNIDLSVPLDQDRGAGRVISVQGDFCACQHFAPDSFDQVFALYSLPMYAASAAAVKLFYLRAMLALRPGGHLRVHGDADAYRDAASGYPAPGVVVVAAYEILKFLSGIGCRRLTEEDLEYPQNGIFIKPDSPKFNAAVQTKIDGIMSANLEMAFDVITEEMGARLSYNLGQSLTRGAQRH